MLWIFQENFTEQLQKITGNVGTKNISAEYELIPLHY